MHEVCTRNVSKMRFKMKKERPSVDRIQIYKGHLLFSKSKENRPYNNNESI